MAFFSVAAGLFFFCFCSSSNRDIGLTQAAAAHGEKTSSKSVGEKDVQMEAK